MQQTKKWIDRIQKRTNTIVHKQINEQKYKHKKKQNYKSTLINKQTKMQIQKKIQKHTNK